MRSKKIIILIALALACAGGLPADSHADDPYGNSDFAYNQCVSSCNGSSQNKEGCLRGCAEARRILEPRQGSYKSSVDCLNAARKLEQNRNLNIQEHQEWCHSNVASLYDQAGCSDAGKVFYGTLTAENFCYASKPAAPGAAVAPAAFATVPAAASAAPAASAASQAPAKAVVPGQAPKAISPAPVTTGAAAPAKPVTYANTTASRAPSVAPAPVAAPLPAAAPALQTASVSPIRPGYGGKTINKGSSPTPFPTRATPDDFESAFKEIDTAAGPATAAPKAVSTASPQTISGAAPKTVARPAGNAEAARQLAAPRAPAKPAMQPRPVAKTATPVKAQPVQPAQPAQAVQPKAKPATASKPAPAKAAQTAAKPAKPASQTSSPSQAGQTPANAPKPETPGKPVLQAQDSTMAATEAAASKPEAPSGTARKAAPASPASGPMPGVPPRPSNAAQAAPNHVEQAGLTVPASSLTAPGAYNPVKQSLAVAAAPAVAPSVASDFAMNAQVNAAGASDPQRGAVIPFSMPDPSLKVKAPRD